VIRDRDPYEGYEPFGLRVFVPAIMSAGLLFSLATLVRDALAGRDRHGAENRAATAAAAVVADVLRVDPGPGELGLRPRRFYLIAAVVAATATAYVVPGAVLNYVQDGGYVSDIAWLLGTTLVVALVGTVAAAVSAAAWWRWPSPPSWARRAIVATPLGTRPGSAAAAGGSGVDPVLGAAAFAFAGAFVALAFGVGGARASFADLDVWLLERAMAWDVPIEWLAALGTTEVALVLALLIGATALRCRAFAAGWALVISGAFAADAAAKAVIERPRPFGDGPTGLEDSFPSGHVVQVVLLAMAVPIAARVVTGRRWPGRVAGVVLGAAAGVTALVRVHDGTHWPTDVLGGALLGATAGFTLHWAVVHERWHGACHRCPWHPAPAERRATTPVVAVSREWAHRLRRTAAAWLVAAAAGLIVLARVRGLPTSPEGEGTLTAYEVPAQYALLGLALLGGAIAARWAAAGATVIVVAALGLGMVAAVEHPAWVSVAVTGALAVPAVLLWLAWQRVRSARSVLALALVAIGVLIGEATAALRVYDHFFGPAHPESATSSRAVDEVEWVWSGDLRPDGATVVARLDDVGAVPVSLVVRARDGADETVATAMTDSDGIVRLRAADLDAATTYDWWVEVAGETDQGRGRGSFTTAPAGAASFTIAAAACARTGSDGAVYDAIRDAAPLLYLVTGDLHYANIAATEPGPFLAAYGRVLTSPAQAALYREVPVDYVWDDHDYGPNDADSTSPGRDAARSAYRQAVPHVPLATDGAIHHAFTIGRVRFVVTDSRSERTDSTMLGEEQLAWLLDELADARRWGLVVWANADPWIAPASAGRDDWGGYADERRTIADAIAAAGVDNLVMVSGDAHMLAVDDGSNSDYSTNGGGGFPVLHAGALDRPGSVKGGPYSEGAFPGAGQFGLLHIDDDGDRVTVELEGRDWTGRVLVEHRFVAGGG
jgi:phosphodiesterase/alkaline phosphatase D-like protein/membrane-associated phospholipid phosphatase